MAKAFAGYQSESGKIHKTEHDAWLDDLANMIAGSGLINEATSAGFVKYLTTTKGAIVIFADIVAHVAKTAPWPEPEAVELRESEPPLAGRIPGSPIMEPTHWVDPLSRNAPQPLIKDV